MQPLAGFGAFEGSCGLGFIGLKGLRIGFIGITGFIGFVGFVGFAGFGAFEGCGFFRKPFAMLSESLNPSPIPDPWKDPKSRSREGFRV